MSRRRRTALRLARVARVRTRALTAMVLALGLLVSLNLTVRALGGDVHPLSMRRVPERAAALGLWFAHRLRCEDASLSPQHLVQAAAERHGISVRLALAVARTESGFVHTRISGAGAMGLMQLMPATARALGVRDPFDVRDNAEGGVRYLAQLLSMYRGDARRAVAAYNVGMARVPRHGPQALPLETRTYVGRVFSAL